MRDFDTYEEWIRYQLEQVWRDSEVRDALAPTMWKLDSDFHLRHKRRL